ncbi:uncharacterized protein LOC34622236 [Cyclospora cayetanensis]|uniref:Myb-like DNA-binding domain-containing protein n=2 Tax=Cyclospora cayetanensis TaxID=88456 RepID=A0A1D3CSR3_9EIME|nr:uncharacterized protein LOC34622236 [Cyclospora cayetanensis]OEH74230.1 myb-like DNA-binding domain-containing protein [Cyclospora cayetanensis]
MVSDSSGEVHAEEDSPQQWLQRLTVKVEPGQDEPAKKGSTAASIVFSERQEAQTWDRGRKRGKSRRSDGEKRRKSHGAVEKPPKEESILFPREAPVYVPALATSQLPFGSSQLVRSGEETFSADQLQLLDLAAPGATGLWRMHTKSGVNYRKGPFTTEERLIVEEALEQYAQREGLESLEEAVRSLSGNIGRKTSGRFHSIARCLPERPFISVYGYIRRRITGNAKRGPWTAEETQQLVQLAKRIPPSRGRWVKIGAVLNRRPVDVCDKWRLVQPRLSQHAAEAPLEALEDKSSATTEADAEAPVNSQNRDAVATASCAAGPGSGQLGEAAREQLLREVQRKTGEDLPSFGVPWRRIQEESFPLCAHSFLRRIYALSVVPDELERRMGVDPRPIILRHILRCFRRLEEQLPARLRGVEWLDILPFVPAGLQYNVVRTASAHLIRVEGTSVDAVVPQLIEEHQKSMDAMRKKDARRLLRAALPVSVQESLEAKVRAKAALKGWPEKTVKKKVRKKIRKAAVEELERLKDRLKEVRAFPLNAPPRGKGQRALESTSGTDFGLGGDSAMEAPAALLDGGVDAETAGLLATPFSQAPQLLLHEARRQNGGPRALGREECSGRHEEEEEEADTTGGATQNKSRACKSKGNELREEAEGLIVSSSTEDREQQRARALKRQRAGASALVAAGPLTRVSARDESRAQKVCFDEAADVSSKRKKKRRVTTEGDSAAEGTEKRKEAQRGQMGEGRGR